MTVELVCVLQRAYGFPRDRIATVLEVLVATEGLEGEAAEDVARAAVRYRRGGAGFSDLMIVTTAEGAGADTLYTFDRNVAQLEGERCWKSRFRELATHEVPRSTRLLRRLINNSRIFAAFSNR